MTDPLFSRVGSAASDVVLDLRPDQANNRQPITFVLLPSHPRAIEHWRSFAMVTLRPNKLSVSKENERNV